MASLYRAQQPVVLNSQKWLPKWFSELFAPPHLFCFTSSTSCKRRWRNSTLISISVRVAQSPVGLGCFWTLYVIPLVGPEETKCNELVAYAGSSSQAERQAVNTVCQGSAADLVKLAMIELHKQLRQQCPAESCKMLLQVGIASLHSAISTALFGLECIPGCVLRHLRLDHPFKNPGQRSMPSCQFACSSCLAI